MTWLVDETYVKIQGTWHYLYPGIDSDGQVLDCWLSRTRDLAAAEAFFRSTIGSTEWTPEHVVTDKATFYPSAIRAHAPYQAVPANSPKTEGFIDVFDPSTMRLVDTFPVPGCENGPTGLALGPNQKFLFNPGDDNFYPGIGGPPAKLGVVNANDDHVVTRAQRKRRPLGRCLCGQ